MKEHVENFSFCQHFQIEFNASSTHISSEYYSQQKNVIRFRQNIKENKMFVVFGF